MKAQELLKKIGIETDLTVEVKGISLKANEVQEGDIFVALKGVKYDGADFVAEAVKQGTVIVLAEREIKAEVPVIVIKNLRQKVSVLASILYPSKNLKKVAITGTNGKTSTVFYVQQLLNKIGIKAASFGTIGVDIGDEHWGSSMTTPDAITLNKTLQKLEQAGVQVVAMEASSHGLDQGRIDGLSFVAGGFTNLTQDHLDYHKTMDAYFEAKSKLFGQYLSPESVAVLNADVPCFSKLKEIAEGRGERVISYGFKGTELCLIKQEPVENGQKIEWEVFGKKYQTTLKIVGDFQVMNLFAALGLCVGAGAEIEKLIPLLETLKAPTGRIELMGTTKNGAAVFVDYAHTPDAVERVLTSMRVHTRGKLICIMGCGGNRDTGKRPLMGEIAAKLADVVYITDDNPRLENPAEIRAAIKAACPKGIEVDNREQAIHTAVAKLQKNDVLVILGKGHEPGQTVGHITYAMDDRVEAKLAIQKTKEEVLWTAEELELALSAKVADRIKGFGISIDTRTLKLGDIFIAIKGNQTDGHAFVKKAVELGASACLVEYLVEEVPQDKQIVVQNTMDALESLAKFARMRSKAIMVGITGSSGKTTTKEMMKVCLSDQGRVHATTGNLNNQIGVPLTLARMPIETKYAIVEMGMNHPKELMHLSDMVRPDVSIITSIGSAHREFFKTEEDVAKAKSEIFDYQNRQGTVVLNKECAFYDFLKQAAEAQGLTKFLSFGFQKTADVYVKCATVQEEKTHIQMEIGQNEYEFDLNFLGNHFVLDAAGVIGVIQAVEADIGKAMKALEQMKPVEGRGAEKEITVDGKKIRLIDDAYNANPSSMAASILSLGLRQSGRKVAVLGDMLELGDLGKELHQGLKESLIQAKVDKVFLVGPLMAELKKILPSEMVEAWTETAHEMIPLVKQNLKEGDVVLVKSSHGTGLTKIVKELK